MGLRFAGSRALAAAAVVALAFGGCTEDPTLDHVGGDGQLAEASAQCDETPADASPRFFPCDVYAVIHAKCQRCHNAPDVVAACYDANTCLEAPFPLLTWSDTHRLFDGKIVFERMRDAVASGYMPLQTDVISPPVAKLDRDEKATLLAWFKACAPPGSTACPTTDAGSPADAAVRDK